MNYGIPTITNANGSFAEIDKNSVFMLEDNFTVKDLEIALETLYYDKNQRENLSKNAKKEIQNKHNPKICAKQYFEAIENSYKNSTIDKNIVIENLASLENLPKNDSDLIVIQPVPHGGHPARHRPAGAGRQCRGRRCGGRRAPSALTAGRTGLGGGAALHGRAPVSRSL